ncbi:glutamyl-tRNA reductase [Singulisphaera sp. GP187]|uniref:glutamyl-tRNA reductase n=1 Tax=Singulisphaera sp. GP187 TaxID=1882752 RepID=UPI00092BD11E|nr:glutamyl-tRNA reductase [Singulisphaera sp. GP187]SIO39460.1 glutamyl-tRNA reductase [Singulisphaera sp. GP187]
MKLLALGVDHRSAPTSIREALAFDGPKLARGLDTLAESFPGSEFVILSTCNRVEIYAAGAPQEVPDLDALTDFLSSFHALPVDRFAPHLVSSQDTEAVAHLFRVAASLESLVLGEGQILGQVKEAYQAAIKNRTVNSILHHVFQNAARVGKKVREETGLDQGKLSIASVAVDVAKGVFDTFSDKTMLVIGAGKMGDLTLQHLKALKPGRILVSNRSPERAEAAAARWGGKAVPFDELFLALKEADVVVSTTAAEEPIVNYDQYVRVQRARRNRLALILDIAIPRDFDPKIGDLEDVYLYNVDDLRAQAEQNRGRRQKGVDPATAIIERETAACCAALRHQRHAGAVLRQLGDHADAIRRREFDALCNARPSLNEADREAIAHMMSRFQNQLLHQPRATLRSAASEPATEHPHSLLNAVRHLFGLADI